MEVLLIHIRDYERLVRCVVEKNAKMSSEPTTPLRNVLLQRRLWNTIINARVSNVYHETIIAFMLL